MPNPLTILAEMIAKLHDKNFHVTVPGFYDDVATISRTERKALNSLPWREKDFRKNVGAPALCGEKGYTIPEQLWCRPTMETNGIWGGYMEEGAKTVIPSKAHAKLSTRLVPNQDPPKIAKMVEKYIRKLLPDTVKCKFEVLSMGKPWVAPYSLSDFSESDARAGAGIREEGGVHPRRRFDSVRHADARHLQRAVRAAGLRAAG